MRASPTDQGVELTCVVCRTTRPRREPCNRVAAQHLGHAWTLVARILQLTNPPLGAPFLGARHTLPPRFATKGAAAFLLLAGCATSSIEARWIDRQIGPRSLAGATISIVCQSSDLTLRLVCADKIATPLKAFGAAALGARPANAANGANETNGADEASGATPLASERRLDHGRAAGATVRFTATTAAAAVNQPLAILAILAKNLLDTARTAGYFSS